MNDPMIRRQEHCRGGCKSARGHVVSQADVFAIGVELGMALERQAMGMTGDHLKRFAKMISLCDDLDQVDAAAGRMCRAKVLAALHGQTPDLEGSGQDIDGDLPLLEAG